MNETADFASNELCPVCAAQMVRRVRISIPLAHGSRTFQTEWYHCPRCNRMRKMIDGAQRQRTKSGIAAFRKELGKSGVQFNHAFHKQFPNNCPVLETDGNGRWVGTCTYSAPQGICPRHGDWKKLVASREGQGGDE